MVVTWICENDSEEISCDFDYVLDIKYASYGRSSRVTWCSWSWTGHCHGKNSMIVVWKLCQGRSSCLLTASNNAFNDPCPNIPKYLKVEYECSRRISTTSSTRKSLATTSTTATTTTTTRSKTTENTTTKLPTEYPDVTSDTTHEISSSVGTRTVPNTLQTKADSFSSVTSNVSSSNSTNALQTVSGPQYQQSLEPGIIAAIAGAGIAALLLILLALILFKRRHSSSHPKQTVVEERHNELYEMNGGYVAAADNSDPGDVTYAQVNKGSRSAAAVPEQSSDNAYAYADQNGQAETGSRMMVDNIIYGTQ